MKGARIETNPSTGEVRVCLPAQALDGLMRTAVVTAYANNAAQEVPGLSADHWEHLLRAYAESETNGEFGLAPLNSGADNVRKSAVEALSHRGYVRIIQVRGPPGVRWRGPRRSRRRGAGRWRISGSRARRPRRRAQLGPADRPPLLERRHLVFGPRPRTVRDYLNDASVKALTCANVTREEGGPARAAACARVMSAVLADVRDAVDLRAPWLGDEAQVTEVLRVVEDLSRRCTYRLEMTAEGLVMAVVDAARPQDSQSPGDEGAG